jgi:hypothetical protein
MIGWLAFVAGGPVARVIITIDAGPGASIGALAGIIGDVSQVMDFGLTVDHAIAESTGAQEVDRLWRDEPGAILERLQGSDEGAHADVRSLVDERRLFDEFLDRGPFPPDMWFEEWYQFRRRARSGSSRRYPRSSPFSMSGYQTASLQEASPSSYSQLVAIESANRMPRVPVVESLTYQNPITIVFEVGTALGIGGVTYAGFRFGTFVEFAKLIRDWSGIRRQREANSAKTQAEAREINARASRIEAETEFRRQRAPLAARVPAVAEVEPTSNQLDAIIRLADSNVGVEVEDDED